MTHNQTKFTINVSNNGVDWENIKLKYFDSAYQPSDLYNPIIQDLVAIMVCVYQPSTIPTWYIKFIEDMTKTPIISHQY